MSTQQIEDPFAGADNVPSVSFKDAPIGTSYTGTVTEAPKLVQARDFESDNPAFWPDGGQKMTVVTRLLLANGEERSLWAAKPSALYRAIADAQKSVGAQIAVGGTLTVTFSGEKPNENKRLNPQKLYTVSYAPPAGAFGETETAPVTAAPPAPAGPIVYTPEQIAAAKAAGIPLPGVS